MQYKKCRLSGLPSKKQWIQSFLIALLLAGMGLFRIAVAQASDCSASSLRSHDHPTFWMLAGVLFFTISGIILWRYSVLKQFQRLQKIQATLQIFNAELSREIRQRQQIEQKLRQSEAQLADAQQVAHIGSWDFDLPTEKITWSKEMFALFGFDPTQPEPTYAELMQRIHPQDRTQWQQTVGNAIATGTSYIVDHRVILPDGSVRYIEGKGKPEVNDQGQVVRLFGTGMDITDRKQAEIALQEKEEQLRLALELTQIGMWDWHIQPDRLFWNENTPRLLDLPLDQLEVTVQAWVDCVHADDRGWVHQQVTQALETHTTYEAEYRVVWQDGTVRWLLGRGCGLYNETGQAVRMVGVILDITERQIALHKRQQAEAALQQLNQELEARTRQLQATNHELESFSYSVSHDLRAPSRHIHGFVSVLRQYLAQGCLPSPEATPLEATSAQRSIDQPTIQPPAIDPKVSHYLDVIESSSRKMGLLIDGLLTLSRVGRRQMQRHPVALNTLVDEAIESAQIDNPEGKAIEFCIGDLPTLHGDAVLLQQVLFNLINNAIKFSRNRDAPCIEIGSLPDQTIFVRDNGIGFAMPDAEHIFDAFQRLHGREFAGTGIGLAIVQRIIHRHNGKVWTESQPNRGATFYFQLGK